MKENTEKQEPAVDETGNSGVDTEQAGVAGVTPEQLDVLKEKAAKADDHWERLLRQTADFDNYKKRAARERQEAIKYANESLLQKLIPIIDNFEMAMSAVSSADGGSADSIKKGVEMIHGQFKSTLAEAGLEEIDAAGKNFDPNFHEAVSQKETAEVPDGQVVQQIRKGYKLRDRLLRPATVIVAKKP